LSALSISPELLFHDAEEMENDLSGLKLNPNVRYIIVTDDSEKVFASYNPHVVLNVDYTNPSIELFNYYDELIYKTDAPIYHDRKLIGHIYLGYSLTQLNEQVWESRKTVAVVCLILFIVSGFIVLSISTVVTRPLKDMVHTSEEIARGNLSIRALEDDKSEIGQLASSFNLMVDHLLTAQKELQEINQTLEERVFERTEKLMQEIRIREEAEQQLRISDEILKQVSSIILVFDSNGNVTYASPSIKTVFDFQPDLMLGNGWWEITHSASDYTSQKLEKAALACQSHPLKDATYESFIVARDGTPRWILWQDTKGPKDLLISVGHDITERKTSEQALLESEKRYRHLFELNPLPGWVYDADTLIFLAVNDAAINYYGYSRDEFLAMTLKDIRPKEDIPKLLESTKQKTTPTYQHSGPWRHKKKDGSIIDVEVSSHTLTFMGRASRLVLVKDITEQKRSEEQLRNLSIRLQTIREDERASIAREIHDELGQYLTGIKMYVTGMYQNLKDCTNDLQKQSLSERMLAASELIDQTISSVQKIVTELRPDVLDKLGLVAAVEWQAQEFQSRTGIHCEVTTELDDSTLDQIFVTTLFRILQETLTNVARHSQANQVQILLITEEQDILLEIRDNGRGISSEELTRTNAFGLIGIRERVSSFHGYVEIAGVPNNGTTVTVRLPQSKIISSPLG
ncbi:MAG: PAS domain S-box protein, partial [Ignavibacteriae bacterium]|nr:PAS domain S-box protein [Ignavibacteriota bacterium]